jgi:hypothetical protein
MGREVMDQTRQAYGIIARWLEWARMHGHLEHAEGIVKDSRELIANAGAHQPEGARKGE